MQEDTSTPIPEVSKPEPSLSTTISELLPLVKEALSNYSKGGVNEKQGITFATVVLISMQAVEKYSDTISKLAGPQKLSAAKQLVPQIIDLAVSNGALDPVQAESLKMQFNTGASIVEQLVEAYVILSKNPQVIQAVEAVKNAASGCFAKCKDRKTERRRARR